MRGAGRISFMSLRRGRSVKLGAMLVLGVGTGREGKGKGVRGREGKRKGVRWRMIRLEGDKEATLHDLSLAWNS